MSDFTELPTRLFKNGQKLPDNCDNYNQESCTSEILYRAPNWSWASVDDQITYPYDNENINSANIHPLISDIDPLIERTEHLYSQIKGSYLIVRAQTIIVTLTVPPASGPNRVNQTTRVTVRKHNVVTQDSICRNDCNGIFRPPSDKAYLMPLLLSFFSTDRFLFTGLLLERTKQRNIYKRVGALNWQENRINLQRDLGLYLLLSIIGTIQWNVGSYTRFQRDTSQLQEIKII